LYKKGFTEMDDFIGKEVFIIVPEVDTITELAFYTDIMDVNSHLIYIDPTDEPEMKVFHGVLSKADSIPSDLKDKSCYVIMMNVAYAMNTIQGIIFLSECDNDSDLLARDIEEAVGESRGGSMFNTSIDDIYILYGYEASTGLCLNMESLDDESVATCKTIVSEAEKLRTNYMG